MDNKKPKHFLILKIIGFIALGLTILGFVLTFTGFGDHESNNFMIGGFITSFGFFATVICLVSGFRPEITKMATKSAKYIQEENKEDLTEIASTTADITGEAVTKTVKAIKKGTKNTMFCKYCGAEIGEDFKFCSKCGKEL